MMGATTIQGAVVRDGKGAVIGGYVLRRGANGRIEAAAFFGVVALAAAEAEMRAAVVSAG